jgi:hypothetical protein
MKGGKGGEGGRDGFGGGADGRAGPSLWGGERTGWWEGGLWPQRWWPSRAAPTGVGERDGVNEHAQGVSRHQAPRRETAGWGGAEAETSLKCVADRPGCGEA